MAPRRITTPTTTTHTTTPAHLREIEAALAPMATIAEASEITRLGATTLRRAIGAGELRAIRRAPTGSSRVLIPRSEIIRYLTTREAA